MSVTVSVQDNKFVPASVTIAAGGTVRWVVDGAAKHDVSGPGFGSGLIGSGESFEWTFAGAGGYTYECEIHNIPGTAARMTGRVIVQ
jgi:plastocyanin